MLNMENLTKWWLALHDNGHIVPGFDNKFGSEMFFVVRGTELQTQNAYKVARTVQWKIARVWNPCEDRKGTESRFFMKCALTLTGHCCFSVCLTSILISSPPLQCHSD